jgi:hypothetical protein
MRLIPSILALAGLLAACAPKSVPIVEESMNECERLVKMTERVYPEKSPEEALDAATRLFRLVDGGYTVTPVPDGLTAQRSWSQAVPDGDAPASGTDTWQVVVKEVDICVGGSSVGVIDAVEGDPANEARGAADACGATVRGVKIAAYHIPRIYEQGLVPSECFSAPVFRPAVSGFTTAPAVYNLFFLRMDYLLHKSGSWTDCPEYKEYIRKNVHYRDQFSMIGFRGSPEALCARAGDRSPD